MRVYCRRPFKHSEVEKEMILDAIQKDYSWIHSELSVNREFIKRKLKTLEYHNRDFNCKGRLFLEKIDSFGV